MPKQLDLTGKRFGKLLVVREGERRNGRKTWECTCDCGTQKTVPSAYLVHGNVQSCGCLRKKANEKVAKARRKPEAKRNDPIYRRWGCMIQRCENPNNPSYHNYGGRGIKVCERWRRSYDDFIADMGKPPTPQHTLDRIDNDGDYAPDNCQWVLRSDQLRNQRRSIVITVRDNTMHAKEWAERFGVSYQGITKAYRRGGIAGATEYVASKIS